MPRTPPVRLAGEEVSERHVCVLYRGSDELLALLAEFIVEGFEEGDHELHLVEDRAAHRRLLSELGMDAAALEDSGQLDIRDWSDRFSQDRPFSRAVMLEFVRHNLDVARGLGYDRTRWVATMEWANESFPDGDELVQFETQLDDLLRSRRDVVVCAYELEQHSSTVIAGVLDAHTLTLSGGVLRPRRTVSRQSARDRILTAAHDYFHNVGIRATGVDTLIEAADVAKATFYRHFPSKDDLVVAWLRDSRPRWFDRVRAKAEDSAVRPDEVIPLIFDSVAEWIEEDGFRGCAFLNAAVVITDAMHPARPIIRDYLDEIESYLREALERAGRRDAAQRAQELSVLLAGGIASCLAQHSVAPALAARDAAKGLLERQIQV